MNTRDIEIGKTYRDSVHRHRKVTDMYTVQGGLAIEFTRVEYTEQYYGQEKPGYCSLRQFAKWADCPV